MKSHEKRQLHLSHGALPTKGSKEYARFTEFLESKPVLPKEVIKKYYDKVRFSLEAQMSSTSGFITEDTLRHFLYEFNYRATHHGLRTMPLLFNLFEAFFTYRKPEIYFELLEEQNYSISFYEFLNEIFSYDIDYQQQILEENIEEDLVYNFNVLSDLREISFRDADQARYIIYGVSLIRRESELTVVLNLGKEKTSDDEGSYPISFDEISAISKDKEALINEFVQSNVEKNKTAANAIFLDEEKKYIKCLAGLRLDISTNTVDNNYFAIEYDNQFSVFTNNKEGFVNINGEFPSDDRRFIFEEYEKKIEKYSEIFEVAKMAAYLPFFVNQNEDKIQYEELATPFRETIINPLKSRRFKDVYGFRCANKGLYKLLLNNDTSDLFQIIDESFNFEIDGHWKKLDADQLGLDKNGSKVVGKTWVEQKKSWYMGKSITLEKNSRKFEGENAGYIYVMRNPLQGDNIFKIGLTRNPVELRQKQLSNTSVPDKFYVIQYWETRDCVIAESLIHEKLKMSRVDTRREFFIIKDYPYTSSLIMAVIDNVNQPGTDQ